MNKPLLIVVCGFLIVSLLSLARFDEIPADPPSAQPQVSAEAASRDDLVNALQTALAQEQRARASSSNPSSTKAAHRSKRRNSCWPNGTPIFATFRRT